MNRGFATSAAVFMLAFVMLITVFMYVVSSRELASTPVAPLQMEQLRWRTDAAHNWCLKHLETVVSGTCTTPPCARQNGSAYCGLTGEPIASCSGDYAVTTTARPIECNGTYTVTVGSGLASQSFSHYYP